MIDVLGPEKRRRRTTQETESPDNQYHLFK